MSEIYNLPPDVNNNYARMTQLTDEMQASRVHPDYASFIPPQSQILDISPKYEEFVRLFGFTPSYQPSSLFAEFQPPEGFFTLHRPIFAFHRAIPSLESLEKRIKNEGLLDAIPCNTDLEKSEKVTVQSCISQIDKVNGMYADITGRMGSILQA